MRLLRHLGYQVRVFAVNCQGLLSDPSPILNFDTLHRMDKSADATGPSGAEATFAIECTGDICVGDTILITERLFTKAPSASGPSSGGSVAGSVRGSQNVGRDAGTVAGRVSALGKGSVRMNMSVVSDTAGTAGGGAAPLGTYVGERTLAAQVIKDNYRTLRDQFAGTDTTPRDSKKFGKKRNLWLEVVWQRSSSEACRPYELKPGSIVQRLQFDMEQFEVFRSAWKQEKARKSLVEEWQMLSDCFVQTDC
jgi:hypothetical protein